MRGATYDLLYREWSPWSPCLRSCLKRRSRTCRVTRWCRVDTLREERRCYAPGTNCDPDVADDTQDDDWLDESGILNGNGINNIIYINTVQLALIKKKIIPLAKSRWQWTTKPSSPSFSPVVYDTFIKQIYY